MNNSVWKAIVCVFFLFFPGSFHSQIVGCFRCCMAIKKKNIFWRSYRTDRRISVCKTKVSHGESRDLVSWTSRDFQQLRRSPHLQFQGEFGSHFHLNHFALLLGAWSQWWGEENCGSCTQLTIAIYDLPFFSGLEKKQINIGCRNCSDWIPPKNNSLFE